MITRATAFTITLACADTPSATVDDMVGMIRGADIGAM